MKRYSLDECIDHMVDALQRDHETNAVSWARIAEQRINDEDEWDTYFEGVSN